MLGHQQCGQYGEVKAGCEKIRGRVVTLPLPDARPVVIATRIAVDYRTLNGGREVGWIVALPVATLEVHANFELEVNVEADLDPRVELMNTEGVLSNLSCAIRDR